MAYKELISAKYQKRLIVIIAAVFLLQLLGTLLFAMQNEFLLHAYDTVLLSTIAGFALPLLLFLLAFFAIGKKTARLWRMTLATVWAFAGMLLNLLLGIGTYFISDNYDGITNTYAYGLLILTVLLYAVGLFVWLRKNVSPKSVFISEGFQRAVVIMAIAYELVQTALILIVGMYVYGILLTNGNLIYVITSIVPIVLAVGLSITGYRYLNNVKDRVLRLFYSVVSVMIVFYIGGAINAFDNALNNTIIRQDTLLLVSYVVSMLIYIPFIRSLKRELRRKI